MVKIHSNFSLGIFDFSTDANSIYYRQDAVENLIDDEKLMFQIQTILLHFTDVERTSRILLKKI